MRTYFVSRHYGALDWFSQKGFTVDEHIRHLDPSVIEAGDIVIGILPIQLAAKVCEAGARYFHLEVEIPFELRGVELSSKDLDDYGAKLTEFKILKCD